MEAELQKRLKEIEELKTQLDELADAQRMVEELTEKNLNLEEYMEEQKVWNWLLACLTRGQASIAELEQLKEMSEELEENQHLVEKRLRSDLCTLYECHLRGEVSFDLMIVSRGK